MLPDRLPDLNLNLLPNMRIRDPQQGEVLEVLAAVHPVKDVS